MPALLLLAAPAALAQVATADLHTITTAVPILTLSPDARSAALGDAGVATSPDANSAFYNPGKLGFVDYQYAFSPSYSPWLRQITDDMSLSYLSGYGKVGTRAPSRPRCCISTWARLTTAPAPTCPTASSTPRSTP
ncbi:MAG: hypothetical protein WKG07_06250 [Hymenobacter sp.]